MPLWSEKGYRLCPFWSGIGYGFLGNYGIVWTYSSFQYQMWKKKEKYANSKRLLRKLFCSCSNLSNDEIISLRLGLKTGVKSNNFWSETGSGFGEPIGPPPRRIPRSTSLPPPEFSLSFRARGLYLWSVRNSALIFELCQTYKLRHWLCLTAHCYKIRSAKRQCFFLHEKSKINREFLLGQEILLDGTTSLLIWFARIFKNTRR